MPNQRALISVSDKTGLVSFAKKLHDAGIELIASGGTSSQLADAGLPVKPTEALTGFPELLDGRVKTLHPAIHGGILARRTQDHLAELADHGLLPIDMVIVNLYPFQQTVADPGVSLAEAVEQIDIGGVALLRAAAKNFESVAVVCEPADYDNIAQAVSNGGLEAETRKALALKAFRHTAAYDAAISNFLAGQQPVQQPQSQDNGTLPAQIRLDLERVQVMRYGENPHQQGALYRYSNAPAAFEQLHGQEMSYNNWLDLDGSWQAAQDFDAPTVAIIKHSNPCGLASAETLASAYDNALASDPVSAFGSIISVNRPLDKATAARMAKLFVEIVAAPSYDDEALAILQRKKNLRILAAGGTVPSQLSIRTVYGGALVQEPDNSRDDLEPGRSSHGTARTRRSWPIWPSPGASAAMSRATLVYVKDRATVGVGAGQMSRVDSVMLAGHKAGDRASARSWHLTPSFPSPTASKPPPHTEWPSPGASAAMSRATLSFT